MQLCAPDLFGEAQYADDVRRLQVLDEEIAARFGHVLHLKPSRTQHLKSPASNDSLCYRLSVFTSWRTGGRAAHTSPPPLYEPCRQSQSAFPPPRGTRRTGWPRKRCTLWSLWWTWLWSTGCRRPAPPCAPEGKCLMENIPGGQSLSNEQRASVKPDLWKCFSIVDQWKV